MKKGFLLSLLLAVCSIVEAQVEVYKTYEDYKNGISTSYAKVNRFSFNTHINNTAESYIKVEDALGNKILLDCSGFWGFKYKKVLFRITGDIVPVALMSSGKVCYYIIGDVIIDMLNSGSSTFKNISYCTTAVFFSKDLESDIYCDPDGVISIFKEQGHVTALNCFMDKVRATGKLEKFDAKFPPRTKYPEVEAAAVFIAWKLNNQYPPGPTLIAPDGSKFNKEYVDFITACMKAYNGD